MTGHGTKFGRKKEEAIAALLTQRNVDEAARSIRIDAKTLLRWMKTPEFDVAYREARRLAYRQSTCTLEEIDQMIAEVESIVSRRRKRTVVGLAETEKPVLGR